MRGAYFDPPRLVAPPSAPPPLPAGPYVWIVARLTQLGVHKESAAVRDLLGQYAASRGEAEFHAMRLKGIAALLACNVGDIEANLRRLRPLQAEAALADTRKHLLAGASISAMGERVLELLDDGSIYGGLRIQYPPRRACECREGTCEGKPAERFACRMVEEIRRGQS